MNESKNDAVQQLIRSTIQRAWVESIGCLIVLFAFGRMLQSTEIGSAQYYGCLLILVSTGFIAGVVWSFTLGYKLLETHPITDNGFWRAAFQTQAKLLRLVPLWYCAPLFSGLLLFYAPNNKVHGFGEFFVLASGAVLLFAFIVWLNRRSAFELDKQSVLFSD